MKLMSCSNFYTDYREKFICSKDQYDMIDSIRVNHSELFHQIVEAVNAKFDEHHHDVMVTIFFKGKDSRYARTCTPDEFSKVTTFEINVNTCPTAYTGKQCDWITENIFVIGME